MAHSMGGFGAWDGSSGGGGGQPSQSRWANALDALSRGLFAIGSEVSKRDEGRDELEAQSKRDAANQAFRENLERFKSEQAEARATAREQAIADRTDRAEAAREARFQAQMDFHEREANARDRREAARIDAANRREDSRADATQRKADADSKRADATAQRNANTAALTSLSTDLKAEMSNHAELQRQKNNPATWATMTDDQRADLDAQIKESSDTIKQLQDDARNIRQSVGHPSVIGSDAGSKASPQAGFQPSQDANGMTADQKALFDAVMQKPNADRDAVMRKVMSLTPDQAKKILNSDQYKAAVSPPSASTAGAPTSGDFLPPSSTGSQPDTLDANTPAKTLAEDSSMSGFTSADSVAQAQPGAVAQSQAAPPPPGQDGEDTSPTQADSTPPQADQSQSQDDQSQVAESDPNEGLLETLQSSPTGQGVITTLNRLASAEPGPASDKLYRQAQIQLGQIAPDADADSFIEDYLSQQTNEPQADEQQYA